MLRNQLPLCIALCRRKKKTYSKHISLTCLTLPSRPLSPAENKFPSSVYRNYPSFSPSLSSLPTIPRLHSFPLKAVCPFSMFCLSPSLAFMISLLLFRVFVPPSPRLYQSSSLSLSYAGPLPLFFLIFFLLFSVFFTLCILVFRRAPTSGIQSSHISLFHFLFSPSFLPPP